MNALPYSRQFTAGRLMPALSRTRVVFGYGAVACALPYLALKLTWLLGGTLGTTDPSIMQDRSMMALNAGTAGMDLVGIGLALAFTHSWGQRIPAWLLLPPMWVATGLLSRFVIWVPITGILAALDSTSLPQARGGPVQSWVYALVYVEFAGLGIGLLAGFVLYARARWTELFQAGAAVSARGATHDLQVPLANATALLASAASLLHLVWALGVPIGLSPSTTGPSLSGRMINVIDAAMMLAASAGVLGLVHRLRPSMPFSAALALAWTGSGSMFGWGLWPLVNVLAGTALMRAASGLALVNLVHLLSVLLGLTMGLVLLMVVAERRAAAARMRGGPQ